MKMYIPMVVAIMLVAALMGCGPFPAEKEIVAIDLETESDLGMLDTENFIYELRGPSGSSAGFDTAEANFRVPTSGTYNLLEVERAAPGNIDIYRYDDSSRTSPSGGERVVPTSSESGLETYDLNAADFHEFRSDQAGEWNFSGSFYFEFWQGSRMANR